MFREPTKLVSAYERGLLTRLGVVIELMRLASEKAPVEIAPVVSTALLEDLRRDCEKYFPVPAAGKMKFTLSVCDGPGYDHDQAMKEFEDSWRAGLSAWQRYFGIDAGCRVESDGVA